MTWVQPVASRAVVYRARNTYVPLPARPENRPVPSMTLNGPVWLMVPTHVCALKRALGCPALWSMRKPPPAKVASSMARPGCSVPPASTTPVMMVPGPDGAVDATWKYSVWADRAGVHGPWADSAHPGPGDQGTALIGSAAVVALAVVVSAEDVPAQAANVAPRMTDATAVARMGRDGLCCR